MNPENFQSSVTTTRHTDTPPLTGAKTQSVLNVPELTTQKSARNILTLRPFAQTAKVATGQTTQNVLS